MAWPDEKRTCSKCNTEYQSFLPHNCPRCMCKTIDEATPEEWDAASRSVRNLNREQPAPKPNAHPPVWPLVMQDMAGRDNVGRERYGVPLQPHNGRDNLVDSYQEALDLCVYLRAAIFERDGR